MGEEAEEERGSPEVNNHPCENSKQRNETAVRSSINLQLIHRHARFRLFPVLNFGLLSVACAQKENIINFVIKGVLSARADVTAIKKLRMRYRAAVSLQLSQEIPYRREW